MRNENIQHPTLNSVQVVALSPAKRIPGASPYTSPVRNFAELLRTPGLARVMASQLAARLPAGMFSLGMLMHVERVQGNYTSAGTVLAAFSIGMAAAGPIITRQLNRFGTLPVLLTCLLVTTTSLTPLVIFHLPLWAMTLLAAMAGATIPPVLPTVRTLYPKLVPPHLVTPLFSLDAALQEIIWVFGPVVITTLVVCLGTVAALLIVTGIQLAGGLLFILVPAVRGLQIPKATGRFGKVLANPSVLLMTLTSLLLIGSLAALEAAVVAWFGEGSLLGGIILAISALGSMIGGFAIGQRPIKPWSLPARLLVMSLGLVAAVLVSGFGGLALALFVSGLGTAPSIAAISSVIAGSVSFADTAEAYGWITTGQLIGAAVGSALAGIAIDSLGGGRGGMFASLIIGALAVVTTAAFRNAQADVRNARS